MAGLIKFGDPDNPRFIFSYSIGWISEILANEKGNDFWFEVSTNDGSIHEIHSTTWEKAWKTRDEFFATLEQVNNGTTAPTKAAAKKAK